MVDSIYGLSFDSTEFHKVNEWKIKKELKSAWTRTLFDLLRVAGHCKHDAFSAEQEWRLAMPRPKDKTPLTEHVVKFRGASGKVPYFESNLFRAGALPIVEIKTGPLCTEIGRVQDLMKRTGYICPVTKSKAPLRDTRTL